MLILMGVCQWLLGTICLSVKVLDTACLAQRGMHSGITSGRAVQYGVAGSSKDELSVSSNALAHKVVHSH